MLAGNNEDAVEQFTKAIDIQPDYDRAYLSRAQAFENMGMLNEAAEDYDRAATFLERDEEVYYEAGRVYFELKEYDLATERLNKSIGLKRTYVEPYQIL